MGVEASSGLRVDEGGAPAATGTFSDPNGGAVTLTSNSGTVTPTSGVGSGTWSWTEPVADESKGENVTVTVTDSHGVSAFVPLAVPVNGVKPTVPKTNHPSTLPYGTNLSLLAPPPPPTPPHTH